MIIQSEALNKSFSRHDALRGISLAVPEGSIYATVFLSSHELDEIEGSTTYVGYLENGRLLFQESMAELSDHVREVRVTLGHDAQIPQGSPGTWISFSLMGNGLSFVDAYSKGYASGRCRHDHWARCRWRDRRRAVAVQGPHGHRVHIRRNSLCDRLRWNWRCGRRPGGTQNYS